MIRVLIVEDSPTICALLQAMLETDPAIRVIGTAKDGAEGLKKAVALKPDLITMDLQMPVMDGLEATRRIMQESPTPIVVVSAHLDSTELSLTFNAIQAGALDVLAKPSLANFDVMREQLVTSVKLMSEVKVIRRMNPNRLGTPTTPTQPRTSNHFAVVAIGASTGGPAALNSLFKVMPRDFPLPIVVVQHMAAGFIEGMVRWMQIESNLEIRIAQQGERILPGMVYFAPDEHHLFFESRDVLGLNQAPPVSHVRPSATVLLQSVAKIYGAQAIGVILSGMGDDGALGLQALHGHGGMTLAQDEATSVVYGMPRVAVELGAVDQILPLEQVAPTLAELTLHER